MHSVEIYLQPNGLPLGQMPLQETIDHLNSCAKQHPRLVGEYRSLILRIEQLQSQGSPVLKLIPSHTNRSEKLHLEQLVSRLVFMNIGQLHCESCNAAIAADSVIFEQFKRGKHGEKAASGKRFYCPRNHLLFEHLDVNL